MQKRKTEKRHFRMKFKIDGIGVFEWWRWYKNEASFIKAVARQFERKCPCRRIFVQVLEIEEIKH